MRIVELPLEDFDIRDIDGQLGLKIVFVHWAELNPVEGGNIGEVVVEMGFDLVVFERKFGIFFSDVELERGCRELRCPKSRR